MMFPALQAMDNALIKSMSRINEVHSVCLQLMQMFWFCDFLSKVANRRNMQHYYKHFPYNITAKDNFFRQGIDTEPCKITLIEHTTL